MNELAGLLKLSPIGADEFSVTPDALFQGSGRLYGGACLALLTRAAAQTVAADRRMVTLHAFFLSGIQPERPVRLRVARPHDGRTLCTRTVELVQDGPVCATATLSFAAGEAGMDVPLPRLADPPGPNTVPARPSLLEGSQIMRRFEVRDLDVSALGPSVPLRTSRLLWVRLAEPLSDDQTSTACLLAYISDFGATIAARTLVSASIDTPGLFTSLNHSLWWHRPFSQTEWLLIDFRPITASQSRGLVTGTVHTEGGVHVASLTQEVMMRLKP